MTFPCHRGHAYGMGGALQDDQEIGEGGISNEAEGGSGVVQGSQEKDTSLT